MGVKKISVDIVGSVVNPGVYELSLNSRIQDYLVAVGKLSDAGNKIRFSN